ncbi:hypothetical protein [Georgenia sp. MJ170]|uniref:hypothetical protein n=1 Tax=Georgenia sunbinii TaxID=3117728 RepID=UPI002F2650FE
MPDRGPSLSELIRSRQDATGESYATIAQRSGLSKAKVGQLADPSMPHMPRAETLAKLATGLQLPLPIIQRAGMITAGITPLDDDDHAQFAPLVERLSQLPKADCETVELIVSALYQRHHNNSQA